MNFEHAITAAADDLPNVVAAALQERRGDLATATLVAASASTGT